MQWADHCSCGKRRGRWTVGGGGWGGGGEVRLVTIKAGWEGGGE
jgi:hypothetical protein